MKDFFIGCIVAIIVSVLLAAFEVWIFSLLWNWIVPIFWSSAPVLTVWQAFGVLVCLNIIFSAFRSQK